MKGLNYQSYDKSISKGFWLRIFGYGISVQKFKDGFVPFSIRNGYRSTLKFFGWYIEFLNKDY